MQEPSPSSLQALLELLLPGLLKIRKAVAPVKAGWVNEQPLIANTLTCTWSLIPVLWK